MKIQDLDTPVLVVDADSLEHNISHLRDITNAAGISCRPHAKTHKSAIIAKMQQRAGAIGICCAKLGEAEVMAENGINDLLITSPVIGESKISRLLEAQKKAKIAVVTDAELNIQMLGHFAQLAGIKLDVLVEIDIGQRRCGVLPGTHAVDLARIIENHTWLNFVGLQGYQGKLQMITGAEERKAANTLSLDLLAQTVTDIEKEGFNVKICTGGGTGSSPFDLERGLLTEIQAGSYVFMDSRYGSISWPNAKIPPFKHALRILTTVISRPSTDRVIVDAGLKAASSDQGPPVLEDGQDQVFDFGGDEHGIVTVKHHGKVPYNVGDKLRLLPSHCDTTVNLYDQFIVTQGEDVVDVWPVDARGRIQ